MKISQRPQVQAARPGLHGKTWYGCMRAISYCWGGNRFDTIFNRWWHKWRPSPLLKWPGPDLEIPQPCSSEEGLKEYWAGKRRRRIALTVLLAPMAPHALGASTQIPAPGGCATIARDSGQAFHRQRACRGKLHIIRFQDFELGDGRQQTLPLSAINLVPEEMTSKCTLLNGVLALSAD